MKPQPKYWSRPVPTHCQLCRRSLKATFIDGVTVFGGWAIMDPACHGRVGRGLGTGVGQRFAKQLDGRWLKVEA